MIHFTIGDVVRAVQPAWSTGVEDAVRLRAVSTDSRHIEHDSLFIGLEGPRFDGAHFAEDAAHGGALCLLATDSPAARERLGEVARAHGIAAMTVASARTGLGDIGREVRRRLTRATVFGITGSVGKTSTKGILAGLLASETEVVSSPASFNNDIGVPRTLLLADEHTEALVVEIGTNGPGEIAHLTELARPRVALVTCVGRSHLEGLGSVEGVLEEKGRLVEGLAGVEDGLCVLNLDCPRTPRLIERVPEGVRAVTVSAAGDPRASLYTTSVVQTAEGTRFRVGGELAGALEGTHVLPLLGAHQVGNALLALGSLAALGAPVGRMAAHLAELRPDPHRLAPRTSGGVTLIDDTYNANPESVAAAVDVLAGLSIEGGRRTLVLGPMGELGSASAALHAEAGELAARAGIDRLVLVGEGADLAACAEAARGGGLEVHRAADRDAAAALLTGGACALRPGDVALLKASRSAALDRLVEALHPVLAEGTPEVLA